MTQGSPFRERTLKFERRSPTDEENLDARKRRRVLAHLNAYVMLGLDLRLGLNKRIENVYAATPTSTAARPPSIPRSSRAPRPSPDCSRSPIRMFPQLSPRSRRS